MTHPFTDVPDGAYYADAVQWAYDNGITTGTTPDEFRPDDPVTRGQMVTMLMRYNARLAGTPQPPPPLPPDDDLVQRLRRRNGLSNYEAMRLHALLTDAADRIEALEAELRLVAETCAGTGGEYWMGTAEPGPILAQMYREALDA